MTDFISNNILPFAAGINFLYANRMSRSLAAGANEQRFLCANDWIARSEFFVYHTQKNVEALCSESFSKRFSYLSYGSYVLVPALYYLSKSLENSENSRLKRVVDFTFSHLPDIILIASVVQAVVGLYFGVNLVQNGIHLTFYLWSFLEQGMYWDRPIENSGLLFKYNNGNLIRRYDAILGTINNWIHLPLTFFLGGTVAKVNALVLGFPLLPESIRSRLIPSFIKEKVSAAIENHTKKIDLEIASTPEKVNRVWVDNDNLFQITQKHFEPFKIRDFFPSKNLGDLEKELQRSLKQDRALSDSDREELSRLLGSKEAHGILYTHAMSANDENELAENLILIKNIFGALAQDWEKRKTALLFHKGDFLCKTATADTVKSFCLELIPNIYHSAKGLSQQVLEKNRVESGIKLVLQQLRDHVFTLHFQSMLAMNEKQFNKQTDSMNLKASHFYSQVQTIKNIANRNWWTSLYHYGRLRGKILLLNTMHHCQQASATSRHQITSNRVLFGKLMGLSGYKEAKRDCELLSAASGMPSSTFSTISKQSIKLMHPYLKAEYLASWRDTLVEAIINLGDQRILFSDVRNLILKIAEERDPKQYDTVYEHALECFEPSAHTDIKVYDTYFKKGRQFLYDYLPLLLHDLGYLEENEDAEVDHWMGIHDFLNQALATQ